MIETVCIGALKIKMEIPNCLQNKLLYFFAPERKETLDTRISIGIRYCEKLPPINNNSHLLPTKFKNITYYYDNVKKQYFAYNKFAFGIINYEDENCMWWIHKDFKNLRSLFHTCFLDPISLLGLKYQTLILHAALLGNEDRGILLMGKSGAGKSTISMLVQESERKFYKYSDDTVQVLFREEGIFLFPIYTGEGYLSVIADEYKERVAKNIPVITINEKRYFLPVKEYKLLELRMLILLAKDGSVNENAWLERTRALEELLTLQTHIVGLHLKKWFMYISRIAKETPVLYESYKEKCDINELISKIKSNTLQ